jgi:hypothetical protein
MRIQYIAVIAVSHATGRVRSSAEIGNFTTHSLLVCVFSHGHLIPTKKRNARTLRGGWHGGVN